MRGWQPPRVVALSAARGGHGCFLHLLRKKLCDMHVPASTSCGTGGRRRRRPHRRSASEQAGGDPVDPFASVHWAESIVGHQQLPGVRQFSEQVASG